MKKADPRVISLKGIQVNNGTIEDGNHLRAFVGVENGFSKKDLALYRRYSKDKRNRYISFTVPTNKGLIVGYQDYSSYPLKTPVFIETSDPELTLSGRFIRPSPHDPLTLVLSFPELVGFLEISPIAPSVLLPRPWASQVSDAIYKASILHTGRAKSDMEEEKFLGRSVDYTLRNRTTTGHRENRLVQALSTIAQTSLGQFIGKLLKDLVSLFVGETRVSVIAIYNGEFVEEVDGSVRTTLSLTNIPLDELRITAHPDIGYRIDFLLMPEDSDDGEWVKVEDILGPRTILQLEQASGIGTTFNRLLNKRFWPDVKNRFLYSNGASGLVNRSTASEIYGGPQFRELINLLTKVFDEPGWVRQLEYGPWLPNGQRAHSSSFALRDYNPDKLAFLLTLTLDVNIATLLGLNTVDRGQSFELPERVLDEDILKIYRVTNYRQAFDYKVEGHWAHLDGDYAYIYYDVSAATTPPIEDQQITRFKTLDGAELGADELGQTARFYRVGLGWEISSGHQKTVVIANDIYRNGNRLTSERPVTPARTRSKPEKMIINGRELDFNWSLAPIPPFSHPQEIHAAEFQYVDTKARLGPTEYAVESVDIFGRYSSDQRYQEFDVDPIVPIPVATDLTGEIRKIGGEFELVTRWSWPVGNRALAPDWTRFDVLLHKGKLLPKIKGAIVWVDRLGEELGGSGFSVDVFVDLSTIPASISFDSLASMAAGELKIRSAGLTYPVIEISNLGNPGQGVGLIRCITTAKQRRGITNPISIDEKSRGILIKRTSAGIARVPFYPIQVAEPGFATDALDSGTATVILSRSNAHKFSPGDQVRVLQGGFLYGGVITSIELNGLIKSYDGVGAATAQIQFEPGWSEFYLPAPGENCVWIKQDGTGWIDWDDATSWTIGPTSLEPPTPYPLQSTGNLQTNLSISISSSDPPRLSVVTNEDGDFDAFLSSVILRCKNFAVASAGLLTGCNVILDDYDAMIMQNQKGNEPQLVTSLPTDSTLETAQTLIGPLTGSNLELSQSGNGIIDITGTVDISEVGVGETRLEIIFDDPLPLQDWRLCALKSKAKAVGDDNILSSLEDNDYYFRILTWRRLSKDRKRYEFIVGNILLAGEAPDSEGINQEIEVEFGPEGADIELIVPGLLVGTFNIGSLEESDLDFYRKINGGEIEYGMELHRSPFDIEYDPDNPEDEVNIVSTVLCVSQASQGIDENIHVAFFPTLNPYYGFLVPEDDQIVNLYPNFHHSYSFPELNEENLIKREPFHVTVRAVVQELDREIDGPLAPQVQGIPRQPLDLHRPSAPAITTPIPVYARPGPTGSTYTLSWESSENAVEYKVYRIPEQYAKEKCGADENIGDVLNEYSKMRDGAALRNQAPLRETTFTDSFESRGGGRYYYKVVAVDTTGQESDWAISPIIPDPELHGPLIVLETLPPATPVLMAANVVNGKVQLEWQSDPTVDEYWIYRAPEDSSPGGPIKLKVEDIDNVEAQHRLQRVPIVAGTETEPIRCMPGDPPMLDLFWMPNLYQIIGIYRPNEYEDWLSGHRSTAPNLYPGAAGEDVRLKLRNGSEEDIKLDAALAWGDENHTKPGPMLVIEYLMEHTVRLEGRYQVEQQEVIIPSDLPPLVKGESASGSVETPEEYSQPARVIVGLYGLNDYETDPSTAQNLYNDSFDGNRITGIALEDGEFVTIFIRQLAVRWARRTTYHSLRIEGYPQTVQIDAVTCVDRQSGSGTAITVADIAFDSTFPDTLTLPASAIADPPVDVIVAYTDDAGMRRSLTVAAASNSINIARSDHLPGGQAPHIKDFVGCWRLQDYDPESPDANLELVVRHGNRMFRREGSFIYVHKDAGLLSSQDTERAPIAIRFEDHRDVIHSVTHKPGLLRFTDEVPYLNTTTQYKLKAVKTHEDGSSAPLVIDSRLSQGREVTVMDPALPIPPDLSFEGLIDGAPILSWPVIESVVEYQLERQTENSPTWHAVGENLIPVPGQSDMTVIDTGVQSGRTYAYRLRVLGANRKLNTEFNILSDIVIP